MKRWKTIPILAVAAGCILAGAERIPFSGEKAYAPVAMAMTAGFGPSDYDQELAEIERQTMLANERAQRVPKQWLVRAKKGEASLSRYRLVKELADLQAAGAEMQASKALAPPRSGPLLSIADYSMVVHDLAAAEAELTILSGAAVPPDDNVKSEISAIRADIAFYRGNIPLAEQMLEGANLLAPAPGTKIREANLLRMTGRFDQALAKVAEASVFKQSRSPYSLSNLQLQMGMIESARGNYLEARNWFQRANQTFPGYWLNQLYLAEAKAISGDRAEAIQTMLKLARSTGHPEIMDALAMNFRAMGDRPNSKLWSGRANLVWKERVALLPLAFSGHAAEHALAFGDPAQAVAWARQNLASRPYGEARILLANALLAEGQTDHALRQLEMAEKSGWRSAPLYAAFAEAFALKGDSAGAQKAQAMAQELNPHIFDSEINLIWFAHG